MRILIDAHVFDEKYQGTRTYLHGLYRALISISPDIEFYFAAKDVENLRKTFGTAVNIHYLQLKSQNKIYRLAIELPYLIKRNRIDCAHFQYISPLIKTCKEIVTIHDLLFIDHPQFFPKLYRFRNLFLFLKSAKRADLLVTVSEFSKKQIVKHFRIDSSKIHITPNAISDYLTNSPIDYSEKIKTKYKLGKYILYVGRLEPRKNHLSLTKAINELGLLKEGYKLVYIGRHDMSCKEHEEYICSLDSKTKSQIKFIEYINNEELAQFYANSELFIFPSFAEGFGIPPIEAVVCGANCLCSNQTAMQDFDFFGERFFNPSNIDELKSKIKKALQNELPPIDEKLIEHIKTKYNWNSIATEFKGLLYAFQHKQKLQFTK